MRANLRFCFQRGFFAIFAGLMYNDFFSVGLQIFNSRYKAPFLVGKAL